MTITPGTTFRHPNQGICTVTAVSAKAVRYSAPARTAGFGPHYYTTTPSALAACLAAGVLTLIGA